MLCNQINLNAYQQSITLKQAGLLFTGGFLGQTYQNDVPAMPQTMN